MGKCGMKQLVVLAAVIVAAATAGTNRYQAVNEQPKVAYACEGSTVTVECSAGMLIRILRANYGRFSYGICQTSGDSDQWDMHCMSTRSVRIVEEFCSDLPSCAVTATSLIFGSDPCPDTPKYLEIEYVCYSESWGTTRGTDPPTTHPRRPTTTPKNTPVPTTPTTPPTTVMTTTPSTTTTQLPTTVTTTLPETTTEDKNLPPVYVTSTPVQTNPPPTTPSPTLRPTTPTPTVDHACPRQNARNMTWPRTNPGMEAVQSCPKNSQNYATWSCSSQGTHWEGSPNLQKCVSEKFTTLQQSVDRMMEAPRLSEDMAMMVASDMASVSENVIYGGDIDAMAATMKDIVDSVEKEIQVTTHTFEMEEVVQEVNKDVLRAGSNLLSSDLKTAWKDLPQAQQADTALEIVSAVEESAFQLANCIETPLAQPIIQIELNIVMEVNILSTDGEVRDVVFPDSTVHDMQNTKWCNSGDSIRLTGNTIKSLGVDGLAKLIFLAYENLEELLKPKETTQNEVIKSDSTSYTPSKTKKDKKYQNEADSSNEERIPADETDQNRQVIVEIIDRTDQSKKNSELGDQPIAPPQPPQYKPSKPKTTKIVNSNIISASINSQVNNRTLPEPITYTLAHKTTENVYNPSCSYWDYSERLADGQWSSFGCDVLATNVTHTTCQCNHLTNFAVLMDVVGIELSDLHTFSLTLLTYCGCVISLVCLLLCWITFTFCNNLQCDRNTIHKHLVANLFIAEVIFLGGIAQYQHQLLCSILAGFLHYFFLVSFTWMCLEGVQLYVMLVQVFEAEKSRRYYYYAVAYGIPAVIVAVSAGVLPEGYGTDSYCWLDVSSGMIWSFVAPVMVVITINVAMLSIAIYIMCKHANMTAKVKMRERSTKEKIRSWLKGAVVLVVLLGLTWGFGLLYVSQHTVVLAYIFTILNSLQGLFIFVFHCLMDERVQKEYKRCVRHATWLPHCLRISYGGAPASTYHSPNTGSSTENYFQKLWSSHRRKRSSTVNSSSIPRSTSHVSSTPITKSNRNDYRMSNSSDAESGDPKLEPVEDAEGYLEPRSLTQNGPDHYEMIADADLSMIDGSIVDSNTMTDYGDNGRSPIDVTKYKIGSPKNEYSIDYDNDTLALEKKRVLALYAKENNPDSYTTDSEYNDDTIGLEKRKMLNEMDNEDDTPFSKRTVSEKNLLNSLEYLDDDDTLKFKKRMPSMSSRESSPSLNDLNRDLNGSGKELNISMPNIMHATAGRADSTSLGSQASGGSSLLDFSDMPSDNTATLPLACRGHIGDYTYSGNDMTANIDC